MREKIEDELKEQILFYREIFLNSSDAIAIIDPDGYGLEQNPAHRELLGYSDRELQSCTPSVHLGEEAFQKVRIQLEETGSFSGEVRSRRHDGTEIYIDLSAFTVRDGTGRILCHVGIKRDVTVRKQAEKEMEKRVAERTALLQGTLNALRDSEERYRRLVERSPDGIAIYCEGRIVFINDAGARILGAIAPEELIGRNIFEFVHPDFRSGVEQRFAQMMTTTQSAPPAEEKLISIDGKSIDAEIAATQYFYQGRPAVQVIVRDISVRKKSELELRESEERYRSLWKQSKEGVFLIHPETLRIQETNPFFLQMLGYTEEEISELTLFDLVSDGT